MKTRIFSLLLSFLLTASLFAQDWEKAVEPTSGFADLNEAAVMARKIVRAAGVPANFLIAEAPVPNAMAVVHGGKRYVLYNPNFIDILTRTTSNSWAAVSVLAHEIGHHLYPNSVNKGKLPLATELEADEFSGFVLRKLGAELEDAQIAMKVLGTTHASRTHPGRSERVSTIELGWNKANEFTGGAVSTLSGINTSTRANPVLPENNIVASIKFNNDPGNDYFVTTRFNVVRLRNNQLEIIGKMAKLDDENFPFMIYDGNNNRIYVGSSGEIVNRKGSKLGRLKIYNS